MARNLSRRRILTHNDFLRFGGIEPGRPARSRGKRARAPAQIAREVARAPAQIAREVDALLNGTRCGCSVNALEADSDKFACPCGDHCTDRECLAENARRRRGNLK